MKLIIIFSLLIIGVLLGCTTTTPPVAENKNCPYITPISFIAASSDIEPTVRMTAWWSRITTKYPQLIDMYGETVPLQQEGKIPYGVVESSKDLEKAEDEGCESLKVSDTRIEEQEEKEEFVASQEINQPRQIYGYFSATNMGPMKNHSDCRPEGKDPMFFQTT